MVLSAGVDVGFDGGQDDALDSGKDYDEAGGVEPYMWG